MGNIDHSDQDTNKSILDFFFNQQNPITGVILFMVKVTQIILIGWLMVLTATKKIKLDVLTCKNSKYLSDRFNDVLKESSLK